MSDLIYPITVNLLPWIFHGNGTGLMEEMSMFYNFMEREGLHHFQHFKITQEIKGSWVNTGNTPYQGYCSVTNEMTQVIDLVWVWKE